MSSEIRAHVCEDRGDIPVKLKEIMNRKVFVIPPTANLREVARKMEIYGLGAIPVCDGRKILGLVTDRDICIKAVSKGLDPEQTIVNEIMTSPVDWCFEDCELSEAAELMESRQIRRLVVVDRNKKLVGLIALGDLVAYASDLDAEGLEAFPDVPPAVH